MGKSDREEAGETGRDQVMRSVVYYGKGFGYYCF